MSIVDQYELSFFSLMIRMIQMKRAEAHSPEQLVALQQKRLSRLLKHVVGRSEFYRKYYREHGVDLDRLDEIRIEDLPVIDKQIMMNNFDQFVCDKNLKRSELEKFVSDPAFKDKKYKGRYEVTHTSGSSGQIGIFVYGARDWTTVKAMVFTRVSGMRSTFLRRNRYAFVAVIDGHYGGISLARSGPKAIVDFLPLDITRPINELVAVLNDFQPDILSGYASGVYLLALEQINGNLKIKPEKVMCSADPLTQPMAKLIRQAFGVEPFNIYAATESVGMATECACHQGFHLFNDWHIFEVVDKNGEPAGANTFGNLIMTNLYNYTQPVIRYRMDDSIILDDKACSCGWPFPLMKTIEGRVEQYLMFEQPNGIIKRLHPIIFVEFIVPGLEKLQVVQTDKNKLQLNVILKADQEETLSNIKGRMDAILKMNQLQDTLEYTIKVLQDIPNNARTGKFKLIVPLEEYNQPAGL